MAQKAHSWLTQEIARLESLYAKRVRDVSRAASFRKVLLLAAIPLRPEMRALPLRGPRLLDKAVLVRLTELANTRALALEKASAHERDAVAEALLRDAAVLEARYGWIYRKMLAQVASARRAC